MKIAGIYKITSPSGRIYIGQSLDIKHRWNRYYKTYRCKQQTLLYNSLVKYGYENHKFEIVYTGSSPETISADLNKMEKHFVLLFRSFVDVNKKGLNLTSGGDSRLVSQETKMKISKAMKGIGNPFYNKKHTESTKNKMRHPRGECFRLKCVAAQAGKNKGKDNPNYGKSMSLENKEKLRSAQLGRKQSADRVAHRVKFISGKKQSDAHIEKRFKNRRGVGKKAISATSPSGELMRFNGAIEMKLRFGLNPINITSCLKGRQNKTNGWCNFKYLD